MIPQQSGKIKFCVMKFANIFLMGGFIHRAGICAHKC